jgi:hypothetical protein
LTTGCAEISSLDSHDKTARFQKAEDSYRASMDWGDWPELFLLMRNPPIEGEEVMMQINDPKTETPQMIAITVPDDTQIKKRQLQQLTDEYLIYLDTIHVSNIKSLSTDLTSNDGQSRMMVQYRFDNSAKVHTVRYTVHWWYDKESNYWFTDTPLPKELDIPKYKTIKLSPKQKQY